MDVLLPSQKKNRFYFFLFLGGDRKMSPKVLKLGLVFIHMEMWGKSDYFKK